MRALLFDTKTDNFREVEIPDTNTLDTYHELLNCDCIDVCNRRIGSMRFEVVVDDTGLFKDNIIVSGINAERHEPMLVGNLLFFGGVNSDGDFTEITNAGIKEIKSNLLYVIIGKQLRTVINMDY